MTTFYRSGNLLCLEGGVCLCVCACSAGGSMGADGRVKKKKCEKLRPGSEQGTSLEL